MGRLLADVNSATASLVEIAKSGRLPLVFKGGDLPDTKAGSGMRWRKIFPGDPAELSQVRGFVRCLLSRHPSCTDAILCATELAANAIRHTASGQDGHLLIEVAWIGPVAAVAVADGGSTSDPELVPSIAGELPESGRGLGLVASFSTAYGWAGDPRGRVVWAEFAPATP